MVPSTWVNVIVGVAPFAQRVSVESAQAKDRDWAAQIPVVRRKTAALLVKPNVIDLHPI